jgi:hypothetical protein
MEFEEGWLQRQVERASKEIDNWPDWLRMQHGLPPKERENPFDDEEKKSQRSYC